MKPYILDKVIEEKKTKAELVRKEILVSVFTVLEHASQRFGFKRAYIFGSISKKNKWSEPSDFDIAIEGIDPTMYFKLKVFLEDELDMEIDLSDLKDIHFRDKVIKEGILWEKKDMPLSKQK